MQGEIESDVAASAATNNTLTRSTVLMDTGSTEQSLSTVRIAKAILTEPVTTEQSLSTIRIAKAILTEDTGKIFERAICLAYDTPYVGPYKYGLEKPLTLAPRLAKLVELVPACVHTAARRSRYDFTAATTSGHTHLSAKSSKRRGAKVAPQVIGQCKPIKFCELVGIAFVDVPTLKHWIQTHVTDILPVLAAHTFDCPNVYWNAETDEIKVVTLQETIDWTATATAAGEAVAAESPYTWTCSADAWANSSTLKFRGIALVEFQFHTKSRTNMAIRWCYDNFLTLFRDHLHIVDL